MDPDEDKSQTDAPTYCADETRAKCDWLKREERGVKHTGRSKHGLQLQQGRKNRIQREMAEQRIGKGDLYRAIDWGEIELVGSEKGIGRLFRRYQPHAAPPHQRRSCRR